MARGDVTIVWEICKDYKDDAWDDCCKEGRWGLEWWIKKIIECSRYNF